MPSLRRFCLVLSDPGLEPYCQLGGSEKWSLLSGRAVLLAHPVRPVLLRQNACSARQVPPKKVKTACWPSARGNPLFGRPYCLAGLRLDSTAKSCRSAPLALCVAPEGDDMGRRVCVPLVETSALRGGRRHPRYVKVVLSWWCGCVGERRRR